MQVVENKWYPARDSNPQNADFKSAACAISPAGRGVFLSIQYHARYFQTSLIPAVEKVQQVRPFLSGDNREEETKAYFSIQSTLFPISEEEKIELSPKTAERRHSQNSRRVFRRFSKVRNPYVFGFCRIGQQPQTFGLCLFRDPSEIRCREFLQCRPEKMRIPFCGPSKIHLMFSRGRGVMGIPQLANERRKCAEIILDK